MKIRDKETYTEFNVAPVPQVAEGFCIMFTATMQLVYAGPILGSKWPPQDGFVVVSPVDFEDFKKLDLTVH